VFYNDHETIKTSLSDLCMHLNTLEALVIKGLYAHLRANRLEVPVVRNISDIIGSRSPQALVCDATDGLVNIVPGVDGRVADHLVAHVVELHLPALSLFALLKATIHPTIFHNSMQERTLKEYVKTFLDEHGDRKPAELVLHLNNDIGTALETVVRYCRVMWEEEKSMRQGFGLALQHMNILLRDLGVDQVPTEQDCDTLLYELHKAPTNRMSVLSNVFINKVEHMKRARIFVHSNTRRIVEPANELMQDRKWIAKESVQDAGRLGVRHGDRTSDSESDEEDEEAEEAEEDDQMEA